MQEYRELLKSSPLFFEVEEGHLFHMLDCMDARKVRYRKGQTVFGEGEPAQFIGFVCEGEVRSERLDYSGNRTLVSVARPGDLFGETFACAEIEQLPVSTVAEKDTVVLLLNSRRLTQTCCNACAYHRQMIYNLLKITAKESIRLHQRAEIISRRTTRNKLLAYLDRQAKETGKRAFTVPFDRQALADYLEVERSGLSAEISKLRAEGILRCNRSEFELL